MEKIDYTTQLVFLKTVILGPYCYCRFDVNFNKTRKMNKLKTTLETSGEDVKTTLETSGENVKTTLETSGEDVKTTLKTSGEDVQLHSERVEKM